MFALLFAGRAGPGNGRNSLMKATGNCKHGNDRSGSD